MKTVMMVMVTVLMMVMAVLIISSYDGGDFGANDNTDFGCVPLG